MAEQRRGLLRLAVLQELRASYGIKVKSGACLAVAKQPAAAAEVGDGTWRRSREGLVGAARCRLGPLPRSPADRGLRGGWRLLSPAVAVPAVNALAVPAGTRASEGLLRAPGPCSSSAGSPVSLTLALLAVKVKA